MIHLNNITTGYSRNSPLLQNFSYSFENKIYGILGESGCEKNDTITNDCRINKISQRKLMDK